MKKIISLFILLSVSFSSLMAQNSHRAIGDIFVNAGAGLSFVERDSYSMSLPPLKLNAEYTLLNLGFGTLSVGAYMSMGVDKLTAYNVKVTSYLVGPMASFHFPVSNNVDLFGRLIVGYVGFKTSDPLYSLANRSGAGAGAYVGGTWYFSPKMGVGAEFGYGGPTSLGIHITFKI